MSKGFLFEIEMFERVVEIHCILNHYVFIPANVVPGKITWKKSYFYFDKETKELLCMRNSNVFRSSRGPQSEKTDSGESTVHIMHLSIALVLRLTGGLGPL